MTVDDKALVDQVGRLLAAGWRGNPHMSGDDRNFMTASMRRRNDDKARDVVEFVRAAFEAAKPPAPEPAPSQGAVVGGGVEAVVKAVEDALLFGAAVTVPDAVKLATNTIRSALSPAPTSGSEAGGEAVAWRAVAHPETRMGTMVDQIEWMLVERADSLYGKGCWTLQQLGVLAKPAPAAGDVREAFTAGLEAAAQYLEACNDYGDRHKASEIRALSAPASAPGSGVAAGAQRQVRHLKRGSTYHVLGDAEVQISVTRPQDHGGRLIEEGDRLTVYRCRETGTLWARFPDEFNDGRFQEIA